MKTIHPIPPAGSEESLIQALETLLAQENPDEARLQALLDQLDQQTLSLIHIFPPFVNRGPLVRSMYHRNRKRAREFRKNDKSQGDLLPGICSSWIKSLGFRGDSR